MKVLKFLLKTLVILIALVLIAAFFLPSEKHIEKSITIKAKPEKVFKEVNTLQQWQYWSPFEEEDTGMVSKYEGEPAGVGAKHIWTSEKSENGSMEITVSEPYDSIVTTLLFEKRGKATSTWYFEDTNEGTKVTWTLEMKDLAYPIERILGLFMDGIIKKSYTKGLQNLKEHVENLPEKPDSNFKTGEISVKEFPGQLSMAIIDSTSMEEMGTKIGNAYREVAEHLSKKGIQFAGQPYLKYLSDFDPEKKVVFEAGFPVTNQIEKSGRIIPSELKQSKTVTTTHFGAYEAMDLTYNALMQYIQENNLVISGNSFEIYITDPKNEPDTSKWETEIYIPVQ